MSGDMPSRIASLPRDRRGLPIPHTVAWVDGAPDFRVIDPIKWDRAVCFRRCGICGDVLGHKVAFVGGPGSIGNRLFTDLPMHRDCAIYALRTCPFLAAPKFSYAKRPPSDTRTIEVVSEQRPDTFGLGITRGFKPVRLRGGEVVLMADPFLSVEWWRLGEPVTDTKSESTP